MLLLRRRVMRAQLKRRMDWVYGPSMALSNLVGSGVVFGFLAYLLPVAPQDLGRAGHQRTINTVAFLAYMVLSMVVGATWGAREAAPVHAWIASDAPAGPVERETVLHLPWRQARVHAVLWLVAAASFGALNAPYSPVVAGQVAGTIVMGGFTTCALGYLVAERVLRPVVGAVHAGSAEPPTRVLGVRARVLLAWALGTAVPLSGVALSLFTIGDRPALSSAGQLFLVLVVGVVGGAAIFAAAGAVSDPVRSVAGALLQVGRGNLDVAVPVYDASEVGELQSGFNAMVEGLRERERLRDLYGRQVGPDAARLAVEQGVQLGGERRDVAVLYVDVVGSTRLTQTLGPDEVVARLNAFFQVVVDVVTRYGGWVNKFEGDATLCLFGAPSALEDCTSACLAAARELAQRLGPLPLDAAIGVGAGPVVAGHVGAESRFEYTVIGDAVNTAARLSEQAKSAPSRLLADREAVRAAGASEQACWQEGGTALLRGRDAPTALSVPVS